MPYSQLYLFNAIPGTNHNANRTNPNRNSKGNPNPTNPINPNTRYRCEYGTLNSMFASVGYRDAQRASIAYPMMRFEGTAPSKSRDTGGSSAFSFFWGGAIPPFPLLFLSVFPVTFPGSPYLSLSSSPSPEIQLAGLGEHCKRPQF